MKPNLGSPAFWATLAGTILAAIGVSTETSTEVQSVISAAAGLIIAVYSIGHHRTQIARTNATKQIALAKIAAIGPANVPASPLPPPGVTTPAPPSTTMSTAVDGRHEAS